MKTNITQTCSSNGHPVKKEPKTILLEVKFGRPGADCQRFGICQVSLYPMLLGNYELFFNQQNPETKARSIVTFCPNGLVEFAFFRNSMTMHTQQKFFHQPYFQLEEPFHFPPAVCKIWGVNKLSLKIGLFLITSTPTFYLVNLNTR